MISICKRYTFEAAHHLPGHNGKCARPHGHSYKVEVEVSGSLNLDEGASDFRMIMDFKDLDTKVNKVLDTLDHYDLNAIIPGRTTAENIVIFLVDQIGLALGTSPISDPRLIRVRLWETEKAYAEWKL